MHIRLLSRLLSLAALLLFALTSHAQVPGAYWANPGRGNQDEKAQAVAVDGEGNSYVTGWYSGTITFGATVLTASANYDIFVVKYDRLGQVVWARTAGGAGDDEGFGIAVDGQGNCFVTGYITGAAMFDGLTLPGSASRDIFLASYDTDGTARWVCSGGGGGLDQGLGVAADAAGNSYITGYITGDATFGSTVLQSYGNKDILAAKYSPTGALIWAHNGGGLGDDQGKGIAVDRAGNGYVTGSYNSSAIFGLDTLTSAGSIDIFVAKVVPNGSLGWVKSFGGAADDQGDAIAVDSDGSLRVTGFFAQTAHFGSTDLTGTGFRQDIFVLRCAPDGSAVWAHNPPCTDNAEGYAIALGDSGLCYVTGYYIGTAVFGSDTVRSTTTIYPRAEDIFVARYNADGTVAGAKSMGGYSGDAGQGIAIDTVGNVLVAGYFMFDADFDGLPVTAGLGFDAFTVKLGNRVVGVNQNQIQTAEMYPNPTAGEFRIKAADKIAAVHIYNALGELVYLANCVNGIVDLSGLPAGLYWVDMAVGGKIVRQKVMVQR